MIIEETPLASPMTARVYALHRAAAMAALHAAALAAEAALVAIEAEIDAETIESLSEAADAAAEAADALGATPPINDAHAHALLEAASRRYADIVDADAETASLEESQS
jgi:hypothetical protein